VRALLNLAPKTARRVRGDGTEEDVALDSVRSATGSAGGRARRYLWTASCSRARARSTNP
jgi:hypothetical protein